MIAPFMVQRSWFSVLVLGTAMIVAAHGVSAAQSRIANAKIETRTVAQNLEREVAAGAARPGASWVGYRVPMVAGPRRERHVMRVRTFTPDCDIDAGGRG